MKNRKEIEELKKLYDVKPFNEIKTLKDMYKQAENAAFLTITINELNLEHIVEFKILLYELDIFTEKCLAMELSKVAGNEMLIRECNKYIFTYEQEIEDLR